MAHGTPSSPEGIEPFYTRIRRGHPPPPEQLADLTRRYLAIGGVSPLTERTAAQVAGIARALESTHPGEFDVRFGSKFEPPLLEEAAASFRDEGFDESRRHRARSALLIDVDRAVHESCASDPRRRRGVHRDRRVVRRARILGTDRTAESTTRWHDSGGSTRDEPKSSSARTRCPSEWWSWVTPIPSNCADSAERAAAIAGLSSFSVAWQSAGRTADTWLGPDILDAIRELASTGVTDIVSCPVGFVSDHLEVLYDIDIEAQGVAKQVGREPDSHRLIERRPDVCGDPRRPHFARGSLSESVIGRRRGRWHQWAGRGMGTHRRRSRDPRRRRLASN